MTFPAQPIPTPQAYAERLAAIVAHVPGSVVLGTVPPCPNHRGDVLTGATLIRRPSGRRVAVLARGVWNRRVTAAAGGAVVPSLVVDVGDGVGVGG